MDVLSLVPRKLGGLFTSVFCKGSGGEGEGERDGDDVSAFCGVSDESGACPMSRRRRILTEGRGRGRERKRGKK